LKILFIWLLLISCSFADDATIEVIKKVESLPTLAVEDSSSDYEETFKLQFFKTLVADLNVVSLFNVDRHYRQINFDDKNVATENKDMNYVLRYKMFEDNNGALNIETKLMRANENVFTKNYTMNNKNVYMFVAHTIAYDINEYMDAPSIEWIKKKVIFARLVGAKQSEIVLSDYTLSYQHVLVRGGFNVFPKWANANQDAFYYTSFNDVKPTLKRTELKTGATRVLLSSDGMLICSDISDDSNTLLLTMAPDGQPDIYIYNIQTKKHKKITDYRGIDVNGQFVDDNTIVFVSNRLGYPNIFSKNLESNSIEQMVYYGKSNSACSAHKDYVVYKARESTNTFSSNTFNLHLISRKTDFIRRLTATGVNEFPRFSKDGDAILFIKNYKNQSSLGIIRLNQNKNYLFPLKYGKIQSIDW